MDLEAAIAGRGALRVATVAFAGSVAASVDPLPPDASYRPLPTVPFSTGKATHEAMKPQVMALQEALLGERYDLADHPSGN
jgi:cytochrome c peroxidase